MKKDERGRGEYARKVGEHTQQYIQELRSMNEKLLDLVALLKKDKEEMHREKLRLQEQVLTSGQDIDRYHGEWAHLQRKMVDVEAEAQVFAERYIGLEQQNASLANLYVASFRLHSTLERQEVLGVIKEIVINLIGSEEIAIFELDPKKSVLSLVASCGIEPEEYQTIPLGTGCIGRAALTGEVYLRDGDSRSVELPEEAYLTACIPLKLDGQVSGVIAIFRLLQQKPGIEALDHELFDLLATHAAVALHCTKLHASWARASGVTA